MPLIVLEYNQHKSPPQSSSKHEQIEAAHTSALYTLECGVGLPLLPF